MRNDIDNADIMAALVVLQAELRKLRSEVAALRKAKEMADK
ncbi:hypothetical protein [Sinisalibacter lacisalsi]|uniref:Transposase n=1 Tax=Sinisalibacter lacisalsi TaxID=1526570 RepID=A0ABQ1QPX1_9RHOB|nr:hypothetical protein [Sinisalibacter lacisalsi]GGD40072.1 hypothetical protein GCM10011358_25020 [Sinisalibacter lacisalsi]